MKELLRPMRVQEYHAHAVPRYTETGWKDYVNLTGEDPTNDLSSEFYQKKLGMIKEAVNTY